MNHWFQIRQRKRRRDLFADTEETVELPVNATPSAEPPKATRKAKVRRSRSVDAAAPDVTEERRLAEVLRLLPPYTLSQAEANYRALIKHGYPDITGDCEGNNARAAELNEAIEYFRASLHP